MCMFALLGYLIQLTLYVPGRLEIPSFNIYCSDEDLELLTFMIHIIWLMKILLPFL